MDNHLNLRKIILEKKAEGNRGGWGRKRRQHQSLLVHLMQAYPFEFIVISDKKIEGNGPENSLEGWTQLQQIFGTQGRQCGPVHH